MSVLVLIRLTVVMVWGAPMVMDYEIRGWKLADVVAYRNLDAKGIAIGYGIAFL